MQVEISFRQLDDAERIRRLDQLYGILLEGAIASAKKGCQAQNSVTMHVKETYIVNNTRNDSDIHPKD